MKQCRYCLNKQLENGKGGLCNICTAKRHDRLYRMAREYDKVAQKLLPINEHDKHCDCDYHKGINAL